MQEDDADAAILVPNCPVCHQTLSLAARTEASGMLRSSGCAKDIVEHVGVPRFLFSDFPLGSAAGRPDSASQASTLELAFRVLETAPAPGLPCSRRNDGVLTPTGSSIPSTACAGRSRMVAQSRQCSGGPGRKKGLNAGTLEALPMPSTGLGGAPGFAGTSWWPQACSAISHAPLHPRRRLRFARRQPSFKSRAIRAIAAPTPPSTLQGR